MIREMLVSVSSVSRRPMASVRSPPVAARSGTPKPAVQMVSALGRTAPPAKTTAEDHGVGADLGHHIGLRRRDPQLGAITLATDRRPGADSDGPSRPPQTNVTPAALLGELGGDLDTGQSAPDHGHRCVAVQLDECSPGPLRLFQFRHGIGERIRRRRALPPGRRRYCRIRSTNFGRGLTSVMSGLIQALSPSPRTSSWLAASVPE